MRILSNQNNKILFLLVQTDGVTAVTGVNSAIDIKVSIGGGPFVTHSGEVDAIGDGWFSFDFNPGNVPDATTVVVLASTAGSLQWRDIIDVWNPPIGGEIPPPPIPDPTAEDLLLEGETLGNNILPADWGRYDSSASSTVISEDATSIAIRYTSAGSNQQVWKLFNPPSGDYVFEFHIEAEGDGGASVNIRQHASPYSYVGYSQAAASGDTVMERITLTVPNAGETIRLQFSFNGQFDNQETYTISGVSLRRIA